MCPPPRVAVLTSLGASPALGGRGVTEPYAGSHDQLLTVSSSPFSREWGVWVENFDFLVMTWSFL